MKIKRNDIVVIDNLRAHKVAGVREAIRPWPIGLLEGLGQPHFQPQLLQVVLVTLLRERFDRGLLRGDRVLVFGDDAFARRQQRLELDRIVGEERLRRVVHDASLDTRRPAGMGAHSVYF